MRSNARSTSGTETPIFIHSFCNFLKVVIWSAMEVPSSMTNWNSCRRAASAPSNPFGSFTLHKLFQSTADVVVPVIWTCSSDEMVILMSPKHSLSLVAHLEMAFISSSDGWVGTAAAGAVAVTWMYESRPFISRRDIITIFQSFQFSDLSFSMRRNKVWRCVDRVSKLDDMLCTWVG